MEHSIPKHFICPISLDLMKDPVTISSGITYDRESIESWLQLSNFTCPATTQTLTSFDLIPNHSVLYLIQNWCLENQNSSLSVEISSLLLSLDSAAKAWDKDKCFSLLEKMKEILSCDEKQAVLLAETEGVNRVLFNLIKDQISPTITKSSLMIIFQLLSLGQEIIVSEFVEPGLIALILEIMVNSEEDKCERALGVFDKLCDSNEGRKEAYNNALTRSVLLEKILGASERATDFSVSVIWKLSKYCEEDKLGLMVQEALQVGVSKKLIVLLQIGCSDCTKKKVTELLKLMNPCKKGPLECIEFENFKNLQLSF